MEYVSLQQWLLTALLFAVILGYEFWHAVRNPHQPSIKSSAIWSVLYIVFALLFGLVIVAIWDRAMAVEYVTGYVTERALSIDNLFVFILIMSAFAVPRHLQQLVMITGVAIAVVLRAIFILLGSAIIERFSWVFYLFGIFLLITAWKLLGSSSQSEDEEYEENAFIRTVRRIVPVTDDWAGTRMFLRQHGVFMLTPLALVMLAIGSTDLLFAFDSIPAIFGITNEAYIVFTANAWALMGMVQLYFLLGGLLERLVYLNYGLAFVLALIGVKLVVHALHHNSLPFLNDGHHITAIPEISTVTSLVLIVVSLAVAAAFSLLKTRNDDPSRSAGYSGD
jgi:tellurite resistance protein TerC